MHRDFVNEEEEHEENETLKDEIVAINSIYGQDTIRSMTIENTNGEKNVYILHLPNHEIWLKVRFAPRYPYCNNIDIEQRQQEEADEQDKCIGKLVPELIVSPPIGVLGTHKCGPTVRKGDATRICQEFEQLARQLFRPGDVYLFDIMEELMNKNKSKFNENGDSSKNNFTSFPSPIEKNLSSNDLLRVEKTNCIVTSTAAVVTDLENQNNKKGKNKSRKEDNNSTQQQLHLQLQPSKWFISDPVRELKSSFLAHCTYIYSANDVTRFRNLLLEQEDKKKLTSATHNIMAWRIRNVSGDYHDNHGHANDTKRIKVYGQQEKKNLTSKHNLGDSSRYRMEEDYDDDGESAAGSRLLHLLQLMDVWNILVIVSRWYGGVNLGPRRFAIINSVARDAILKATSATSTSKPRS